MLLTVSLVRGVQLCESLSCQPVAATSTTHAKCKGFEEHDIGQFLALPDSTYTTVNSEGGCHCILLRKGLKRVVLFGCWVWPATYPRQSISILDPCKRGGNKYWLWCSTRCLGLSILHFVPIVFGQRPILSCFSEGRRQYYQLVRVNILDLIVWEYLYWSSMNDACQAAFSQDVRCIPGSFAFVSLITSVNYTGWYACH